MKIQTKTAHKIETKTIWFFAFFLTVFLCAFVFAEWAVARSRSSDDDVEVYSSTESRDDGYDSRTSERSRGEIRISRPDEAASRVADDLGYEQVKGVHRISAGSDDELLIPKKVGRTVAAEQISPVPVREEFGQTTTLANAAGTSLSAEVIEPRKFTSGDAGDRRAEARAEAILPEGKPSRFGPPGSRGYGIGEEAQFQSKVNEPIPQRPATPGIQEISVIVSDYGYFPNRIFVTQNVPVKLYLTTPSKVTMCFMLDSLGLKKGVAPGRVEELVFTPDSAGDYRFYCPVKSIEGKITVREAPMASQSLRGLATEAAAPKIDAGQWNQPKNAAQLRQLIED